MKLLEAASRNRQRLTLVGIVLALAALGAGMYRHYRPDPQLAKIRELSAQLRAGGRQMPRDQRRQAGRALRQEMRKLTPEQRRELGKARQEHWREQMKKFFQSSKEEQTAYLDRLIKQGEEPATLAESKREQSSGCRGCQQRQQDQNANGDRSGRRQRGDGSPEAQESRRKQALDRSTPEDRAMRAEFRQMVQERRQQLGLPAQSGGGGRGRGQRS